MRVELSYSRQSILGIAFLAIVLTAHAQTNMQNVGVAKGFRVDGDYFSEGHPKSRIEGAEGRPIGKNFWKLTQLKLTTFQSNGVPEMIVLAPDCLFDGDSSIASSPGPLIVQTADGQFNLQGTGFQWSQNDSMLYISNDVHSVLHKVTTAGTEATPLPPDTNSDIDVFSDHFTRDLKTGISVYQDNVRVIGTNINLTSDVMSLNLPFTNGVVTLTGHATWANGSRNGGADLLVLDRDNNLMRAFTNAFIKMPGTAIGTNSTGAASTNKEVVVLSDQYELQTNLSQFYGNVQVTQYDSNQPTGKLTSQAMTAFIAGGNAIQSVDAETNVIVSQQDGQFTSDIGKFYASNSTAIFTGHATWTKGDRSGAGETLFVDQALGQMTVWSNAMMKLPGSAMDHSTNTSTVQKFTTITSDNYLVKASHAEFHNNAHIIDPKMNVTSELLTADSLPGQTNIERVVADKNVVGDLIDTSGKVTHVTGQHALYTLSDGLLRLTGAPVMQNDQGWLTGSIIVWDRTYDLLIVRNQRMVFQASAMTNGLPDLMNGK